jgi:hypothetical protein
MQEILQHFEGKMFGEPKVFLGMTIQRDIAAGTIRINQGSIIRELVRRTGMEARGGSNCPLPPGKRSPAGMPLPPLSEDESLLYPATVGSLLYIATVSRPDIAFAASSLARYLAAPTRELLDAALYAVRYLKATADISLVFGARRNMTVLGTNGLSNGGKGFQAIAYGDADFANCEETRRSITGIVVTLDGTPVVWASRKQPTVAKSTTAAEYIAASMTVDEGVLVQKLMTDLGTPQRSISLLCDNTAAECLLKNPIENGRTKYLEIHWHYCRELIASGKVCVSRVDTQAQLADVCTKAHNGPRTREFRNVLCLL